MDCELQRKPKMLLNQLFVLMRGSPQQQVNNQTGADVEFMSRNVQDSIRKAKPSQLFGSRLRASCSGRNRTWCIDATVLGAYS